MSGPLHNHVELRSSREPAVQFVSDTHDHKPDAPSAPAQPPATSFSEAYPAPWRIQGAEVVDAEGCHVNGFEIEDPEELAFWRGICLAVNVRASLLEELAHARHYVHALSKRSSATAIHDDLARIDLAIAQAVR